MAPTIFFRSNSTNYYLSQRAVNEYTGSGTPWTVQATSPFLLAVNDAAGERWAPPGPALQPVLGAGGNVPSLLVSSLNADIKQTTIPIKIFGDTPANAMIARRTLLAALNRRGLAPAVLGLQVDNVGSPATVYYEILAAEAQDVPYYLNEGAARGGDSASRLTTRLTLTLRAYGGQFSTSGDPTSAVINGTSLTNSLSLNLTSAAFTGGDMAAAGQPMNIRIAPSGAAARYLVASVQGIAGSASGFVATALGGTAVTIGSLGSVDVSAAVNNPQLSVRLIVRISSLTGANASVYALIAFAGGSSNYYQTETVTITTTANGRLIDFGDIPIPTAPDAVFTTPGLLQVFVQATGSGNITVNWIELVNYWEFCLVRGQSTSNSVLLSAYTAQAERVALPLETPVGLYWTGTSPRDPAVILGDVPLARDTGSLWIYQMTEDQNGGEMLTARTMTVTAKVAPLYQTVAA